MELATHETPIKYLRRISFEPMYQEQSAEIVVPDSMPDMDRILDAYGTVVLQDKRCENDTLVLSGGIQAGVLYQPEKDDPIQKLEAWLPFSVKKRIECSEGCFVEQGWLKSIDARLQNTRKVTLRANLGIRLTQLVPEEFQLVSVDADESALQLRRNIYPAYLPVDCADQEFRLQDELTLPESVPAVARILKWDVRPNVEESRVIGTKAVFKGDVVVEMLYLGTDDSVNTWVGQLPYSQYVELDGEWPDADVAVFPAVTSAQLETDGQMESRTLLIDLGVLAQVCVIDRIELELTEDAYAVGGVLTPVWQSVALQPMLDRKSTEVFGEIHIPVKAHELVCITLLPDQPTLRRDKGEMTLAGGATGSILYRDDAGKLQMKPFRGELSSNAPICEDCRCVASVFQTESASGVCRGDEILLRVPVCFRLETYQEQAWQNLSGGSIETTQEQQDGPSVIVRKFSGGELWEIAKQYGTTMDTIRAANGLKDNLIDDGVLLLIPMR